MTPTTAKRKGSWLRTVLRALLPLVLAVTTAVAAGAAEKSAVLFEVKGVIGPAMSDYLVRGFAKAREQGAAVIVLRIDTPGGLDTSMREIIREILASPIPVLSYVAPSGARAASAGTYILYASHVAAMAPGTNLGAATPIQIGGVPKPLPLPRRGDDEAEEEADEGEAKKGEEAAEEKEKRKPAKKAPPPTLADKAVSDAAAYIRSLAQLRGRNVDWAEQAVREASSLSAEEALEAGVIDLVARDVEELLALADGRVVRVVNDDQTIASAEAEVTVTAPDWRTELLALITNPNVAYILLLIGMYGLIYEFTHPGLVAPGVAGAISLMLALFALHVLPINYAGLGLILLGISFMVAEAFVPAFGALGIGGVIAFVIGSLMLFDVEAPGFGISRPLIFGVAASSSALFTLVLTLAVKARRRPVVSGAEEMIGSLGRVTDWRDGRGRVQAHGEIWQAHGPVPLEPGAAVRVTALEGLTLVVEPAEDSAEDSKET
jgi:membrane-bound serine protease (ClpP class)